MRNGIRPDRWFPARPKSVLNRVTDERMPFDWSINPYRGCGHGCHFCYARQTHTWLGFHTDDSFRNNIFVKREAAEVLRRELKRGKWKGGGITIGTATDPYQQLEGNLGITRAILEVLRDYGIPVSITTRSPLILRDTDILSDMKITSVNVSISTLDEEVWKKTEPSSPHPRQRLRVVRELNRAGVPTGVFLAPVMPYLTDGEDHLEGVVRGAAEHGAKFLLPSVLRLKPEVKDWFLRQMQPAFPKVYPHLVRLYGVAHAPEEYRREVTERIFRLAEAAGLPCHVPPMGRGRSEGGATQTPAQEAPVQLSLF